jgi:predicted transcriptional regulator
MPKFTITVEEDYPTELRERLEGYGISLGALARETGIDRSQVTRLFNTPVDPRLSTITKIEIAILVIRERAKRKSK